MKYSSPPAIASGSQGERENYRLCFRFEYGTLDDGNVWIRTPKQGLFHIDWLTLRLLLELNAGISVTELALKYKLEVKEIHSLVSNLEKEGAIVLARQGKITMGQPQDDIHLAPFIFLFILLGVIQIEYFQRVAHTAYLKNWYEAAIISLISILPIILHEAGHYLAAKPYFTPRFGFTFLWLFPAAYVDTQPSWCLPRNIRLLINSAGLLSDLIFNTLLIGLVLYYPGLEYYLTPLLILQYTCWSIILNPLVNGDGYWLLADASKTVNLKKRGREHLRQGRFHWLSIYGFLSFLFSLFSMVGLGWWIMNLSGKTIPPFWIK